MKRQQTFNIKGMTRDVSSSKSGNEYAYEIKNMRITAQEGETLLSLVNEKGNKKYNISLQVINNEEVSIEGTIIGYCIISDYLTLFTHNDSVDNIYKLWISKADDNTLEGYRLYQGDLGFTDDMILDTLGIYESEVIQKVYWIDGVHQPRFINIAADDDTRKLWKRQDTPFDFISKYEDNAEVSITKSDYSGTFPAATVQYAMTYYNLNGQQTNIFYQSPLYYTAHSNRGAAADETVSNSFTLKLVNADPNFDYVRVYQIMRTSANADAACKILIDIPITIITSYDSNGNAVYKASEITITDTGNYGTSVDPYEIIYAGGRDVIPQTMAQKDNTLFLGNFKVDRSLVPDNIVDELSKVADNNFSFVHGSAIGKGTTGSLYMYENQLSGNSQDITTFKGGENYRFGLVFQDEKGEWSNVVYLCDKHNSTYPDDNVTEFKPVKGKFTIPSSIVDLAVENNYRKVRGVVVYPSYGDRQVICQGVLCPTVYNISDRRLNQPYAQSSWFFRDMHMFDSQNPHHLDYAVQNRHNYNISTLHSGELRKTALYDGEIYGASREDISAMNDGAEGNPQDMFVDWNVLTLNTPELDFEDTVLPTTGLKLRIVGAIPLTSSSSDININTSTAPQDTTIKNFRRIISSYPNLSNLGNHMRLSEFDWYDKPYNKDSLDMGIDGKASYWQYPVFPWQRSSSIINQIVTSETSNWISEINTKIISNIRTSAITLFKGENGTDYDISDVGVYNGVNALVRLSADPNDTDHKSGFNYYGEVDTTLLTSSTGYKTYALYDGSLGTSKKGCQDGIRMKYKSSPHAVFQLRYTSDHKQTILPALTISGVTLGTQANPSGLVHWADDYASDTPSTTEEQEITDSERTDARVLKARIDKYTNGSEVNKAWIEANQDMMSIEGIGNTAYEGSFPNGWIDATFLRSLVDNDHVSVGDVIIFPNIAVWNNIENLDAKGKEWQDKPLLYRVMSLRDVYTGISRSGEAYSLQAMRNDDYDGTDSAVGFWRYTDKTNSLIYYYEVVDSTSTHYTGAVLRETKSTSTQDDSNTTTYTNTPDLDAVLDTYTDGTTIDDSWIQSHSDLIVLGHEEPVYGYDGDGGQYVDYYEIKGNFISTSLLAGMLDYPKSGDYILIRNCSIQYAITGRKPNLYAVDYVSDGKCYVKPIINPTAEYWKYDKKDGTYDIYQRTGVPATNYYCILKYYKNINKIDSGSTVVDSGHLSQGTFDLSSNSYASRFAQGSTTYGFMYIGELYRNVDTDAIFGGKTASALQGNTWNIAGKAVSLTKGQEVSVPFDQGDTYYQRYDCLKTYPYTNEDPNQIVEILSFMCETRINIDGRYDTQRGQSSNLTMRPTNFNLLNHVYTQNNNFFGSNYLDYRRNREQNFPNTIMWSKTKTFGEDVDSWTNIQQASVLDLDGDKGSIRALRNFNDSLLSFQDNGIAKILYNERVQINASDGVPIEIANSGKVQGKQYISDHIGCNNKRSIVSTSSGLYFMDGNSKDIYVLSEGIQSLSKAKGFNSWLYNRDFSKFRTFFDEKASDIYFVDDNACLVYNEQLGEFTGFYSYEGTNFMFNLKDQFSAIKSNGLWHQFAGDYNYFYGDDTINYQPFSVTVISNQGLDDKTFTNIDFLADSWEGDTIQSSTFDTLSAWNEYQLGVSDLLTQNKNKQYWFSNLKRKFRIWRADIPRAMYVTPTTNVEGVTKLVNSIEADGGSIDGVSSDYSIKKSMDRIRNTWAYIKLSMQNANKKKTILHNLTVDYFD